MKNKLNIVTLMLIASTALFCIGCGGARNWVGKTVDGMSAKDYKVTVWSGGVAVKEYQIESSFVNSEETSDGWFFYVEGKLVRVAGTVTVEEL